MPKDPTMQKTAVFALPRPSLVFSFLANEKESRWKKLALLAAVLYVVFPLDAVPDLIPVWGWLDDLGVTTLALAFLSWVVAPYAVAPKAGSAYPGSAQPAYATAPVGGPGRVTIRKTR